MTLVSTVLIICAAGVPVFKGFEASRYQMHDEVIERAVREFNRHRGAWADANRNQAKTIPDITPALVKAHMIQESGGAGKSSVAAWYGDPLQVNVPGDWGEEKAQLGLCRQKWRNKGGAELNIRAAIKYLADVQQEREARAPRGRTGVLGLGYGARALQRTRQ